MRSLLVSAGRRAGAVVAIALLGAAATPLETDAATPTAARAAVVHTWSVAVHRGGADASIRFWRGRAGEAFVDATVSARGVSWDQPKNESAVVSAFVDGHYVTDIVITSSSPVTRQFALGSLGRGRHTLRLHYAAHRSRSLAGVARLNDVRILRTVAPSSPEYAAARYAPVLYGRNLPDLGGRFQNSRTDTPLVAWHQVRPAATPGHSVIEYSVIWSNEDGGTDTAGLMARWGRTTDIEWVYRVEVDGQGHRVAGSGVYQAPAHATLTFHGHYDGTHPLLETCTANNNVCDKVTDPMRFALSTREVLPDGQPREHEMDLHPWTYQVMALEMVREHQIESPSDPATIEVGDQRSYLYVAVDHVTSPSTSAGGVGLAVDVQLQNGMTYKSDHQQSPLLYTINRNGPAATTVELPSGTTSADIASISVRRAPFLAGDQATLTVTDLNRAFFLGSTYLPRPSFAQWHGSVTLTAAAPTAQLWPPAG